MAWSGKGDNLEMVMMMGWDGEVRGGMRKGFMGVYSDDLDVIREDFIKSFSKMAQRK